MNIDTEDIVLLPNAFAEDVNDLMSENIKCRNNVFPKEVLILRGKILDKLEKMKKDGHSFSNLNDLYTSLCSYWKTLEDLGDGILNCKDLEEINKVRNEIATKCSKLLSKYDDKFYNMCDKIIDESESQLNKNFTEDLYISTTNRIEELYNESLQNVLKEYDVQTNVSFLPEDIKRKYRSSIESSFRKIKNISINTWENVASNRRQLEKIRLNLIKYASVLIQSSPNSNSNNILNRETKQKFHEYDEKYKNYLSKLYESDEKILKNIQDNYNENHNRNIFIDDFKEFELTPKINDLHKFVNMYSKIDLVKEVKALISSGPIAWVKKKVSNFDEEKFISWVTQTLVTNVKQEVMDCIQKPFVKDAHIRNVFIIVKKHFFNNESIIMKHKNHFKLNEFNTFILKMCFSFMFFKYIEVKNSDLRNKQLEYEIMKSDIFHKIQFEFKSMKENNNTTNSDIGNENTTAKNSESIEKNNSDAYEILEDKMETENDDNSMVELVDSNNNTDVATTENTCQRNEENLNKKCNRNFSKCDKSRNVETKISNQTKDTLNFSRRLDIIKLLKENETSCKCLSENFSTILVNEFDSRSILTSNNVFISLKPYLFDALKRFNRISSIRTKILEFISSIQEDNNKWSYLSKIEDRDLLCGLMVSENTASLPKLGTLIVKNDYPLPLAFSVYKNENIDCYYSFKAFEDILSFTNQGLAVVSGTKNAIFKGKSSIIPLLFNGLHEERSIFKSKSADVTRVNNVDLICNGETCEEWVIADFHSEIQSDDAKCLLKAFAVHSTIHIINTTIDDFNNDGSVLSSELQELLEWYIEINQNNAVKPTYIYLLIRDFDSSDSMIFDLLKKYILNSYKLRLISVIAVENLSDTTDEFLSFKKRNLIDQFNNTLKTVNRKPLRSVYDVKHVFMSIKTNSNIKDNIPRVIPVVEEFKKLFKNLDLETTVNIFPIANINGLIKDAEESLKKMEYYHSNRDNLEKEIRQLKKQRFDVNPMNDYMKLFIKLLSEKQFLSNLVIFENCLIDLKRDKLKDLRKERVKLQGDLDSYAQLILKNEVNLDAPDRNRTEAKKTEATLDDLKRNKSVLETELKKLDNKIDTLDLTIDKFWDEIFSIYDWILEKEKESSKFVNIKNEVNNFKSQFDQLIDCYIKMIEYGNAIHILRGKPLKIQSKALERVFEKLKDDKELYIITVIGEQSSAKSSLLNSLFGCDFRTSAGRCTAGIYMNFVNYKDKKIVILDTEGLMSVESGNTVFDNQMATMAVFSSHLIIINHKGEISSNLERLLGITFYAKLQTQSSHFKPSVMFVLRDQNDRNESSVATQAMKLKSKLIENASKVKGSIDDVMNIDIKDIVLLPNAFAEDKNDQINKKIKWRNNIFPEDVLNLRVKLLDKLAKMNMEGHVVCNLSGFYISMCSYWKTLEDLGDGILNCKDLEEIKVRNEIATKCSKLINKYNDKFYNTCLNVIDEGESKLNIRYTDNEYNQTINKINELYTETLKNVINEYEVQTNVSFFPEDIKREYRANIKSTLTKTQRIVINTWEERASNRRQSDALEKIKFDLMQYASDLIKSNQSINSLNAQIQHKLCESDRKYKEYLSTLYASNEKILKNIQDNFNENHKRNIFTEEFSDFEVTPRINDLDQCFYQFGHNINIQNNIKELVSRGIISWFRKKIKNFDEKQFVKTVTCTLEDQVKREVTGCISKPFVEDAHIRNVFIVIKKHFFNNESIITKHKSCFNINEFNSFILKLCFYFMYVRYVEIRDKDLQNKKSEYEIMKDKIYKTIQSEFECMKNSSKSGEMFANDLIKNIYKLNEEHVSQDIRKAIDAKLFEILKDPEELIENAFNRSFKAHNYENVYKYVKNITKYCIEVSHEMTKEQINAIIQAKVNVFRQKLNELFRFFTNYNSQLIADRKHAFIDELMKLNGNKEIKDLLEKCKKSIIDANIENIEHFNDSFKKNVNAASLQYQDGCGNYASQIEAWAQSRHEEELKKYLGCVAVCPGCGSKCHLENGHLGDHKSKKHILNGFYGWKNKYTKIVSTDFCWETSFYLNSTIFVGEGEDEITYKTFEEYLEKCYKEWLSDIKDNYIKYGKQEKSKQTIDFTSYTKKAWMNTRKPILRKFEGIKDRQYEHDWLRLEDKNEMLLENFQCDGY